MPEDRDQENKKKSGRSARLKASARKKQAERKKVVESGGSAREDKPRSPKSSAKKRRADSRRKPARRRASERDAEDRPRRSRRRPAPPSRSRHSRKERRRADNEPMGELVEPSKPPEAEIDLMGELSPAWEIGLPIGGGLCLTAVVVAVISLLMSPGGQFTAVTVIGLVILLMAIAGGGVGVLARKIWGYVLGMGATALGALAGLLWSVYAVVMPDLSPWLPLAFFLSNLLAALALYQMRWGPGLMADERDRYRAMKRNLASFTTAQGELAHSAAIVAVLASLLGGLMLLSANTADATSPQMPANFADGMNLENIEGSPEEGSIVLARWGNEDYFFLGRVDQSRNGDEYHITYLDGDEAWVRASDLRQDAIRTGASVHIHVQGHEGWLPAQITQRANNRVEADIGPQRVWVPLAMVRVRQL